MKVKVLVVSVMFLFLVIFIIGCTVKDEPTVEELAKFYGTWEEETFEWQYIFNPDYEFTFIESSGEYQGAWYINDSRLSLSGFADETYYYDFKGTTDTITLRDVENTDIVRVLHKI